MHLKTTALSCPTIHCSRVATAGYPSLAHHFVKFCADKHPHAMPGRHQPRRLEAPSTGEVIIAVAKDVCRSPFDAQQHFYSEDLCVLVKATELNRPSCFNTVRASSITWLDLAAAATSMTGMLCSTNLPLHRDLLVRPSLCLPFPARQLIPSRCSSQGRRSEVVPVSGHVTALRRASSSPEAGHRCTRHPGQTVVP
mmetsp:Transcript_125042/g.243401  ORF Transcript_125042/g.243401 Transcript_125042/m.243401 type:complete len:196 (-) Transcript_125042:59-646(-)